MDTLSIILLSFFGLLFILGPISGVITARRRERQASERSKRELYQARRKLSTVTACSTNRPRSSIVGAEPDLEADVDECPICIGPLKPEAQEICDEQIQEALDELSSRTKRHSLRHWTDRVPFFRGKDREETSECNDGRLPQGHDVLTLNSCGHAFHAKCLASWLALGRHDCPVCRGEYYKGPKVIERPRRALVRGSAGEMSVALLG